MDFHSHDDDVEEVAIHTAEGLQKFLQYASEALFDVHDALQDGEITEEVLSQRQTIFTTLKALVERCQLFLRHGDAVSDYDVERLQTLYDQLTAEFEQSELPDEYSRPVTGQIEVDSSTDADGYEAISINVVPLYQPLQAAETRPEKPRPTTPQKTETPLKRPSATLNSLASKQSLSASSPLAAHIKKVLRHSQYRQFLSEYFPSLPSFEAHMRREILAREKPSQLDTLLGVKHNSAFFAVLHDMTIEELEVFDSLPSRDIRSALSLVQVPYEIYVGWLQDFFYMKKIVSCRRDTTFGELFVSVEIELLRQEFEERGV
jgi:hypothetical protein